MFHLAVHRTAMMPPTPPPHPSPIHSLTHRVMPPLHPMIPPSHQPPVHPTPRPQSRFVMTSSPPLPPEHRHVTGQRVLHTSALSTATTRPTSALHGETSSLATTSTAFSPYKPTSFVPSALHRVTTTLISLATSAPSPILPHSGGSSPISRCSSWHLPHKTIGTKNPSLTSLLPASPTYATATSKRCTMAPCKCPVGPDRMTVLLVPTTALPRLLQTQTTGGLRMHDSPTN